MNLNYQKYKTTYDAYRKKNKALVNAITDRHNNISRFNGMRDIVYQRDNYCCVDCGMTNKEHLKKYQRRLSIDHHDGNRNNNQLENLKTRCLPCHGKKDRVRRKTWGKRPDRINAKRDSVSGRFI